MTLREAAKWLKGDAVANIEVSWIDMEGGISRAYCSQRSRTISEWYKDITSLLHLKGYSADHLIGFRGLMSDIGDEVVLVLTDRTDKGIIYQEVFNERI